MKARWVPNIWVETNSDILKEMRHHDGKKNAELWKKALKEGRNGEKETQQL